MSDLAPVDAKLSDLDLAALLCSRVCHDVISPVGAIANGLELIDDPEMDAETKATALDMVRSSAKTAAAKLKFCRIAFGAAGSAGALVDMGEAGEIAKAFVGDEKVKLEWNAPRENRPKQQVKLVLNMMLMAMALPMTTCRRLYVWPHKKILFKLTNYHRNLCVYSQTNNFEWW